MGVPQQMLLGTGSRPVSRAYTDTDSAALSAATYTFTAMATGTAAGDRKMVAHINASADGFNVTSATIAGVAATMVARVTGGGVEVEELWQANVPTGTTGDVVVNLAGVTGRCCVDLYAVYGAAAAAHATASSTANPLSASLAIPANGIAIGGAGNIAAGGATWANLTEDVETNIDGTGFTTAASTASTPGATPTITCTWATPDGIGRYAMILASWGPA